MGASILDITRYAITSLGHRQLRSYLTVLGIVIGIAAIVSLVSITQGLSQAIDDQLSSFGTRTVIVIPGDINKMSMGGGGAMGATQGRLWDNDAQRIAKVPGVTGLSRYVTTRADVGFQGESITAAVSGVEPADYTSAFNLTLENGRWLMEGDQGAIGLGGKLGGTQIFTKDLQVGSVVRIGSEGKKFRVVGILNPQGDGDTDNSIFMPLEESRDIAGPTLAKHEINGILFLVDPRYDFDDVLDAVTLELASAHKVKVEEKDFSFITAAFIKSQTAQITTLMTLFMVFISSIALFVGGVGVANTMYMTVMERTREIGTLKAIGAPDSTVMLMFVAESGLMSFLGGLIGIAIGWSISLLISAFAPFKAVVTVELVAFAAVFSLALGLVFGYLPARSASKLPPIEALRYE